MSQTSVLFLLLVLLILFLAWTPSSTAIKEVEIKNDGTVPDGGGDVTASITDSFSVAINNRMEEKMTVYWYDAKKVDRQQTYTYDAIHTYTYISRCCVCS